MFWSKMGFFYVLSFGKKGGGKKGGNERVKGKLIEREEKKEKGRNYRRSLKKRWREGKRRTNY